MKSVFTSNQGVAEIFMALEGTRHNHFRTEMVALLRELDDELDGAVSQLRKRLHLRGKPQEVLFLCCCILDLEPEMIAEILDMSRTNVYVKRSRLRTRVRELNDPLLTVLVEKC